MKKRKLLAGILTALGIILIINSQLPSGINLSPGNSPINFSLILGLGFLVGGIFWFFGGERYRESWFKEGLMSAEDFGATLEEEVNEKKKVKGRKGEVILENVLIFDTSALIPYNLSNISEYILSHYGEVYVPEKVLDEIYDKKTGKGDESKRKLVMNKSKRIEGFEKYRKLSEEYIKRAGKSKFLELLKSNKKLENRRDALGDLTFDEFQETYKKLYTQTKERKDKLRDYSDVTKEDLIQEAEQHYPVSPADIDVLSNAIYQAKQTNRKKRALVIEKDTHLRGAIKLIKKEHPYIGERIDVFEPYKLAA